MIDAANLKRGQAYTSLPNMVIIFILPYDPFGCDRMIYTIQNMIKEEPSFDYNDGALKMILYTKGKAGNASKELQDMLKYFESSITANVTNPDIEFMHHMVERLKERGEINLDYMKSWEWDEYNQKIGRDQGLITGREEGRVQGHKEGHAEGLLIGREEGLKEGIFANIATCRKYKATNEEILNELMLNFSLLQTEAESYLEQYSDKF